MRLVSKLYMTDVHVYIQGTIYMYIGASGHILFFQTLRSGKRERAKVQRIGRPEQGRWKGVQMLPEWNWNS